MIEESQGCADFTIAGLCRSSKLEIAEPDFKAGSCVRKYSFG